MFPHIQARVGTPNPENSNEESFLSAIDVSSAGTDSRKQPTYTTVGSIYKPNAATQLQPPTRRPRIRRYPQPIRSPSGGTFFPFPETLLSALPLNDSRPISPPTTAATLQQYSPLQQNYHRAATPVTERDSSCLSSFGMPMPNGSVGNTPSPAGFEGNDGFGSEDALTSLRISTKGLTSLASYPNPMQKAAQNKWAKARTVNFGLNRPDSPSSLTSTTPDPVKDRPSNGYGSAPAPTGPPQPLTAGPPGFRHFKSSGLDATSKAFRPSDQAAQVPPAVGVIQPRSSIGLQYNAGTGLLPAFDDEGRIPDAGSSIPLPAIERYHRLSTFNSSDHAGSRDLFTPGAPDIPAAIVGGARQKVHDTLPPERIMEYYPHGLPSNYDGRHKPIVDSWHNSAQDPFLERRSKINRSFYSGTEGLVKNMEQIVRDHNYRCLENKIGVIGEERERLRGSHIERLGDDGKVQPPYLSVEEVAKMDDADVTRPLLNMVFATLLRYKEESDSGFSDRNGWPSSFTKADDSLVDKTEEGSMSFFGASREEQVRKKSSRKPRRGY